MISYMQALVLTGGWILAAFIFGLAIGASGARS